MPYLRGTDFDRAHFRESDQLLSMNSLKTLSAEPAIISNHVSLPSSRISESSGISEASREDSDDDPSQPPSPPNESQSGYVQALICPVQSTPLIPPENYGTVEPFKIFRSGKPWPASIDFLGCLGIRSVLSLVKPDDEGKDIPVTQYLSTTGIVQERILIQKNKGELRTTTESLCEALLFIMNPVNQPVYIHCNMGKHRTGCVVACLRKCQQWPIDEVLAEYHTYAGDKARATDVEVIKAFDPDCVYEHAKKHKSLDLWPRDPRQDSAVDIWDLAAVLPAHERSQICQDAGAKGDDLHATNGLTMKTAQKSRVSRLDTGDNVVPTCDVYGQGDMGSAGAHAECCSATVALYRTASMPAIVSAAAQGRICR